MTPICIDLHILPMKAKTNYKRFLLTHKALQHKETLYLNEMLEQREL